ncbi:MAG: hypothetical protein PVH60_01745 [Anaerolineales bacterium]|jgi:hypothetical protein
MRNQNSSYEELKERELTHGMMLGMLLFFPFGVALSLAIGNPGMIGVGVAIGLPVGLAIGEHRFKKRIGEE